MGKQADVPLLDHRTLSSTKLAWVVAVVFAISSLIVVISYFGGLQISWHVINLADSQTVSTPLPTSSNPIGNENMKPVADKYLNRLKLEKNEIYNKYKSDADNIIDYLTKGKGKGQAYDRLAYIADYFGHRLTGSKALENTIDYLVKTLNEEGLDNVHKEEAPGMPYWIRGYENATLLSPRKVNLKILGLGNTVPTPKGGICAEAIVVRSFDELDKRKKEAKGKIVVFYQHWVDYPTTVAYRENGASAASKYGAVAVLIRSVTNHSVYSPHTGMMSYDEGVKPIPSACLTVEDAAMLYRMEKGGSTLKICLEMTSHPAGTVTSHNTVAELRGSEKPDEIVLISGHLDSWDVGTGAMDDGAGVIIAWQALSAMKALGLRPKRTVRAVFWTAEEQGHVGSAFYYNEHKKMANETYRFVYESDSGAFKPRGLNFSGSAEARGTMQKVMDLLEPIGANGLFETSDTGDVDYWRQDGVPAAWLEVEDKLDYYFTFHHTDGDNMIVFKPDDLDYSAALTAVVAFVVADMEQPLPLNRALH